MHWLSAGPPCMIYIYRSTTINNDHIWSYIYRSWTLHDLSVLAICRTTQINSRSTEINIYILGSKMGVLANTWWFAWVMSLIHFKTYLTVIQVSGNFQQFLSSTGEDIYYWVYVLTLEVTTCVCNLTWQGRLHISTTTTIHTRVTVRVRFSVRFMVR